MPNPVPEVADLLLQYPKPPFPATDSTGKPSALYLQWATGLAALKIAKSLEIIDARWLNTTGGK